MAVSLDELQDFAMDGFGAVRGIDDGDAGGLSTREGEVALADFFVELAGLTLHAVKLAAGGVDTLPGGVGFEIEQDGEPRARP
jgi:hypothetical protein